MARCGRWWARAPKVHYTPHCHAGTTTAAVRFPWRTSRSAWGVFTTEVYPSYDFVPVRERIIARVRAGGQ